MDAIRTEALTREFRGVTALAGLELVVAPGEIFALVGPDGAGKTTAMRILASILRPTDGEAWVDGLSVVRDAVRVKERIGYMAQRFGLYEDLTVEENIGFYAEIYGVPRRERVDRVARLLEFARLGPFRRRLAGRLSGGMKQKLGLACALVHTPRILLLDEPTNGVDPVARQEFWKILRQLREEDGLTVFLSTSYLDEAERADRLVLLHRGRVLSEGTPGEVKDRFGRAILEVRADRPRAAAGVLRSALPDRSVVLFGDRVHLTAEAGAEEATRNEVERVLAGSDAGFREVAAVPPNLEDVFVAAVGDEEASGGGD